MIGNATVEILLGTFNGETFLREQIDSILAQDYRSLRVLARDDGSSDETAEILREYARRYPERVLVLPTDGPTGGPKGNFLRLMDASTADYVCFSDQDDVWLPDKLTISMQAMHKLESQWGCSTPLLVFTDLAVVDRELGLIHKSFWELMKIDPRNINRPNRLILSPVVTGCASMLNRALLDIAMRMPKEAYMHDLWIGLLAATMGRSMAIPKQTVLYRQHGNNVIGTGRKLEEQPRVKHKVSFWRRLGKYQEGSTAVQWKKSQEQAAALLAMHRSELRPEARDIVDAFRRCELDNRRMVRLLALIRYGFFGHGILANLARVTITWNKKISE